MGSSAVKKEEWKNLSMVDLAFEILKAEKQPLPLQEMINQLKETKQLTDEEAEEYIARFYTNLNLDGRFIFIGENHWGLKNWYPFDQTKDEIEIPKKKKKRKKKKKVEDEEEYAEEYEDDEDYFDDDDYDEYDEDEDDDEEDDEESGDDSDEDED